MPSSLPNACSYLTRMCIHPQNIVSPESPPNCTEHSGLQLKQLLAQQPRPFVVDTRQVPGHQGNKPSIKGSGSGSEPVGDTTCEGLSDDRDEHLMKTNRPERYSRSRKAVSC